jgi:hypothetical protein
MSFRPAKFRQTLGCLLLLMIIYGATVEAAHSHGAVSTDTPGIAAISDAGGLHSDTNHSHYRECVMCQFQQQLFNGLVHAPLLALTLSTQIAFASTLTVLHLSSPITQPTGRAPPLS